MMHVQFRAGFTRCDLAAILILSAVIALAILPAIVGCDSKDDGGSASDKPGDRSSVSGRARENALRKKCVSNLKQIALAAIVYADQNNDRFPDANGAAFLSVLYQTTGRDPQLYLCPSSKEVPTTDDILEGGKDTSYSGRKNANADYRLTAGKIAKYGARTILAADRADSNHGDVRMACYADGHVEELEFEWYRHVADAVED